MNFKQTTTHVLILSVIQKGALPIIRTILKNQGCNIYKIGTYNRKLRVVNMPQLDYQSQFPTIKNHPNFSNF